MGHPFKPKPSFGTTEALEYQQWILPLVSRTFALTIPQLPTPLMHTVANAYLLCRINDTIEDEVALTPEQKDYFLIWFRQVVLKIADPADFSETLSPMLSKKTLEAERDLIKHTPAIMHITHSFPENQYRALANCVDQMGQGMPQYQRMASRKGLPTLKHLDRYCYYVAGVVGEMLTELFCDHSKAIARHRTQMQRWAISFGQGLQMTNILKDVWEDDQRDVCWLPQDVFKQHGFALSDRMDRQNNPQFIEGIRHLIGLTHAHLQNALNYTLCIPRLETGIRQFNLWALGLALLTLQNIHQTPHYQNGQMVKVSRSALKKIILSARLMGYSNTLLKFWFQRLAQGLPWIPIAEDWDPAKGSEFS